MRWVLVAMRRALRVQQVQRAPHAAARVPPERAAR